MDASTEQLCSLSGTSYLLPIGQTLEITHDSPYFGPSGRALGVGTMTFMS
jgi:hypothetical protein